MPTMISSSGSRALLNLSYSTAIITLLHKQRAWVDFGMENVSLYPVHKKIILILMFWVLGKFCSHVEPEWFMQPELMAIPKVCTATFMKNTYSAKLMFIC